MLWATVSGSFHRHLPAIEEAVLELRRNGVRVLSPEDPRVVDAEGPFLFVASDRHRAVRLVQDRHLASVSKSDLLWLECPDGYVGTSAALEVGFAVASGIPVFATRAPDDVTLQEYVEVVGSIADAVSTVGLRPRLPEPRPSILISPDEVVDEANRNLEEVRRLLSGRRDTASGGVGLDRRVRETLETIREDLRPVSQAGE